MTDTPRKARHPLTDDAIETRRGVSRRSLLLGTLGGGAALITGTTALAATDTDSGRNADPAGRGYTGYSDSDGGSNADDGGHGRRRSRRASVSDSDGGSNADPAGRGYTGRTDSDGGRNADDAGHGRN